MEQPLALNTESIKQAYQTYLPSLRSYLYRMVCDRETANDLAQDTFIKALEKQDSFKANSSYKTWLFSIGTNLAIDWLRKHKRWDERAQDKAKALAESDPVYRERFKHLANDSAQGQYEVKEHIDFCFTCTSKTLPLEQQVSLLLKEIYDFKISEISLILSQPEGTVKHWLFNSRKTMNDIFERRCALINKNGVCHQCSELNGFFNAKQIEQENALRTKYNGGDSLQERIDLVKTINPLTSKGAELQDSIMQVLRKAIGER